MDCLFNLFFLSLYILDRSKLLSSFLHEDSLKVQSEDFFIRRFFFSRGIHHSPSLVSKRLFKYLAWNSKRCSQFSADFLPIIYSRVATLTRGAGERGTRVVGQDIRDRTVGTGHSDKIGLTGQPGPVSRQRSASMVVRQHRR